MAWYESGKFWYSLTVILVVIGTFIAVMLGSTDDLVEVLPFLGTVVGGGAAGYALGKKTSKEK
jgi:hypothetical protein